MSIFETLPRELFAARAAPTAANPQQAQVNDYDRRDGVTLQTTPRERIILFSIYGREMYGLEVQQSIAECSGGEEHLTLGTIYPILRSLETKGLLEGRWGDESPSERAGARRRYYRLTEKGLRTVEHVLDYYQRLLNWRKA